jgi:Spy/CpxP family protein refolding chaperone
MNRILIILTLVVSFSISGIAQERGHGMRGDMSERFQAEKISFITKKLELTPEEAQLFWPLYNELGKKRKENREQTKILFRKLRSESEEVTEKELSDLSDELIELKLQEAVLQKEYHLKYKKILTAKKILTLYHTEKQFQNMLLRQIKERGRHQHGKQN